MGTNKRVGSLLWSLIFLVGLSATAEAQSKPKSKCTTPRDCFERAMAALQEAHTALRQSSNRSAVPIGTILPYAGENTKDLEPTWMVCKGQTLNVSQYPALYAALGEAWGSDGPGVFKLPNLVGRFLRGVDTTSTIDPDAAKRKASAPGGYSGARVGTIQEGATATPKNGIQIKSGGSHKHTILVHTVHASGGANNVGSGNSESRAHQPSSSSGKHGHDVSGFDKETRPKNAAVVWIVRVL